MRSVILFVTALTVLVTSCKAKTYSSAADFKGGDKEKFSYLLGTEIGNYVKNMGIEVDIEAIKSGLSDGMLKEEKKIFNPSDAQQIKQNYMQSAMTEKGKVNKAAGEKFLTENKGKEGVKVTPSGLQYKVIKEGSGAKPTATNTVKVHYVGTLIDGSEFDSSYKRGQPAVFPLNGVIPGWTEGLQLMTVGSKYKFFIPSHIAYGERGPGKIGPNSTLIFDVELISIEK
ncbi:MAG: FKBP-type peptidyl-prolyl cis-trans isomerase [Leptospiraceae bacterium]|nr:FKBP-type peptidyl-prolyl cis-trans isomerase [Leptospiraceae bacterium]